MSKVSIMLKSLVELDDFLKTTQEIREYFLKVDVKTLDKDKAVNQAFLAGYNGKKMSNNYNAGSPLQVAWKVGHDRKELENK